MEHKEKDVEAVPGIDAGKVFSVWVDEGGSPQFFEQPHCDIPPQFFVHLDAQRAHLPGDYVLASTLGGLFFGKVGVDGSSLLIGEQILPLEPSLLILGVVIAGFEWFTLP